jgi:hypothetical protein
MSAVRQEASEFWFLSFGLSCFNWRHLTFAEIVFCVSCSPLSLFVLFEHLCKYRTSAEQIGKS